MITTVGKGIIRQSLTGFGAAPVGSIAIGVGDSPETVDDVALEYEIGRAAVDISSVDQVTGSIIYKAVIPAEVSGTIYEIGAWSESSDIDSSRPLLLTFEPDVEEWSIGTYTQGNSRIGEYGLTLTGSSAVTTELLDLSIDISTVLAGDLIAIALNASANSGTIELQLLTDDSNYLSYTASPAVGYQIITFQKGAMTQVGSPDLTNLNTARIIFTPTASATVTLDGLKISTADSQASLVSRKVLSSPLVKSADLAMEIEYRMDVP